ncbi:hypothetical protein CHS0354_001412 [Potamilus streckersoni]|uniref:Death domain-containing protein n=1 Tax=Potamilus streckersoni TaxID=2493646 RepID=A0AAE0W7T5_9BIVA|nr:hypothetical protein CHS0354_001412 [Potamilus streckersoni]
MKSTEVQALTTSFVEFITTKLIDIQVIQTVESRTVLLSVLPSQNLNNDEIRKQEGVITSTHQIRLEEGSLLCWKIRGNLAVVQDQFKVFAFHSFLGINLSFPIEVVNEYTQRSLSTYVGFIQLYSLEDQRTGPLDKWVLPNIDTNWKHLLDIPLTLPKPTITDIPTSWKAPTFVPNEGEVAGTFGVDLRGISARVSGDWYRLARALNLQHPRIQSIVQRNKTEDRRELAYQILLSWFKRTLHVTDKECPTTMSATNQRVRFNGWASQHYTSNPSPGKREGGRKGRGWGHTYFVAICHLIQAEMLVPALRRCQKWQLAEELAQRNRKYKLEKREILQENRYETEQRYYTDMSNTNRLWQMAGTVAQLGTKQ